jgi:serine/threonine-protein kinase RsbW
MPSSQSHHIEKSFAKEFASLKAIFEFVTEFSASNNLDDSQIFPIRFAIEEVFTNMVKYNPGSNVVSISLDRGNKEIKIRIVDVELKPFDITKKENVNLTLPIESRRPGGLGIFLIKKLMDKVEYLHDGTHSRITLTKYMDRKNV